MPMIDLPREQLATFEGRNPKPDDFDAFWDGALEEMENQPPNARLEAVDITIPGAECFDMWFTGVGSAKIHVKHLRPKGSGRAPALLVFHGYRRGSASWSALLQYVCAGFAVFAMDCRGQGGFSQDVGGVAGGTFNGHFVRGLDDADPHKLLMHQIMLDTAQLARIVCIMEHVNPGAIAAMGASQGGGLALACAALSPAVKKTVTMMPFLCDYKRVWELDLGDGAYDELREYFKMFDPRHTREDAIFTKLGYIDVQHLASRIGGRVLLLTGQMDTTCPPSAQYAAYNRIVAKKQAVLYPDFGHEVCPDMEDTALRFLL